jgi:hypothetical protein
MANRNQLLLVGFVHLGMFIPTAPSFYYHRREWKRSLRHDLRMEALRAHSCTGEIHREIPDDLKLDPHVHTRRAELVRTFEIGARRMNEFALSGSKRGLWPVPRGTSPPYPGLSSVALIYVLVSDVTRVCRRRRRSACSPGVGAPSVCTKDPQSYYPERSVYK